jgi:tetratricopeptide (TPR) repeat protein
MHRKLQQAFQFYQQGKRQQAEQTGRNVLAHYPRHPDALHLMGLLEKDRGSLEQACQLFQRGLKSAPGHVHLLNSIGLVESQLGEFSKAEAHFRKAMKIDPGYIHARHHLANLFDSQRKYSKAKHLYHQVLKQQPKFVEALANLSSILEKEHQLVEARSFANRALEINPDHFVARITLANIAARDKSFDAVIELLLPLVQSQQLSPVNYAVACGKCAYAYEQRGDYKTAFSFYQNSNQVLQQAYQPQFQNLESLYAPSSIKCIDNAIPNFDFSYQTGEIRSPVFMIGFPRSGTTLLDQILSSHSHITVLEEKENLLDAYTRFPATREGLSELENASDAELKKLRQMYWNNIDREINTNKSTPIIVDKLPLNAIALLHIIKLFPGAKIIIALRDPRDSVFSCYQQRFGMNQAMFQFLNLNTAVTYYDQVMNVIAKIRDVNVLPMHFVRYEEVVGNLTDEVKELISFLDLEWEDALLDYQTTARSRSISTPSASQVIQPLYTSSIGKWKHYREWIGTSFEPLDKWVEEWGYQKEVRQ